MTQKFGTGTRIKIPSCHESLCLKRDPETLVCIAGEQTLCMFVACSAGVFFYRAISPIFHCHKIKDGGYNNITNTNKVSPSQMKIRLHCRLHVWGRGGSPFHFPLLAIFSPLPQTDSLFTGYRSQGSTSSLRVSRAAAMLELNEKTLGSR